MRPIRDRGKALLAQMGKEVRRLRLKLGLSQAALAAKAGLHGNVVGRTERGTYNPSVLTLHSIAGALHTSIVHLLRDNSSTP